MLCMRPNSNGSAGRLNSSLSANMTLSAESSADAGLLVYDSERDAMRGDAESGTAGVVKTAEGVL